MGAISHTAEGRAMNRVIFENKLEVIVSLLDGRLSTAYSDAKLGEKNLCLDCVLISCSGGVLCRSDVSIRYQAIKRLFFSCIRIFSPFFNAPAAHDVTQDCKFFIVDGDGLCH
jgi:hypothetical protein